MQFEIFEVAQLPVAVIDNFFTEDEADRIWSEIVFLSSGDKMKEPGDTGTAFDLDEDGNKIWAKKNKGLFLDDIYADRSVSDILTLDRKIFYPDVHAPLVEKHAIFQHLEYINRDCSLLSYYEDTDYYNLHVDDAVLTVIVWFFKQPKQFEGGRLIFENDLQIECEYNRAVVFPSILKHGVDPIKITDERYKNKNYGRYTLTQLCNYH